MKKLCCLALTLIFCSGCGVLQPRIPGSGIARTEYRPVSRFNEIEFSGFGTVNVTAGQQPTLQVTTDDNLLCWVETEVVNGKLQIKPTRKIWPKEGLVIDVTVPDLTAAHVSGAGDLNIEGVTANHLDLSISGAGDLNADQVFANELEMSISGAGDLTASGQVRQISTRISGAGTADLQDLVAERAKITISGAGDVDVYASQSLNAQVSGAGSVVCYGHPPEVTQNVSGAGSISLR